MKARWLWILLVALPTPLAAVGMGPLSKMGMTDGAEKAFWLSVMNPADQPRTFTLYALDEDWQPLEGVDVRPKSPRIAARRQTRVLAIVRGLAPGESRVVRVCAEELFQEGQIHARVCSKLTARRIPAAGRSHPSTGE